MADTRTIPGMYWLLKYIDFSTNGQSDTPAMIAQSVIDHDEDEEESSILFTGVDHRKCIELIHDLETLRAKPPAVRRHKERLEKLKKMPRAHSAANSTDFYTPKKVQSIYQKESPAKLARNNTGEKGVELMPIDNLDHIEPSECETLLKRILKPYKLSHVPIEFLNEKFVYYNFHGTIGKQSKVMKSIMERKIKVNILEGKLIEYKDAFDYPEKPNRVSKEILTLFR